MLNSNKDKDFNKSIGSSLINSKREDIFSNASKKIRLTKQNPLEDEEASDDIEKNTRELFEILDYLDKVQKTTPSNTELNTEQKLEEPVDGKNVAKHKSNDDENTQKTNVFGNIEKSNDFAGIDDSNNDFKTFESKNEDTKGSIPIVSISVGKFSSVVREQYKKYSEYDNNSNSEENKTFDIPKNKITEKILEKKVKLNIKLPAFTKGKRLDTKLYDHEFNDELEPIKISNKLYSKATSLYSNAILMLILTIGASVFFILKMVNPDLFNYSGNFAPIIYCAVNLLLVVFTIIIGKETIISGLTGIKKLGNQDTAPAIAAISVFLHSVLSFFYNNDIYGGRYSFYTLLLLIVFLLNIFAKLFTNERIRKNYRFINNTENRFVLKKYNDKHYKSLMLSGIASDRSDITYQKRVDKLENFFDISYDSYSGMVLMNKASIPIALLSIVISVIYAINGGGLYGFVTALVIINCCAVPVSAGIVSEYITKRICKNSLKKRAMIAGYASARVASTSSSVMIDIRQIYPKGALQLTSMKKFGQRDIDTALINALSITKSAESPLSDVLLGIFKGITSVPEADSVIYEDGKGLIGWVNGERILVGSAQLLNEHGIDTPSKDYESKYLKDGNHITYIANSGVLSAMLVIKYRADYKVAQALQTLEDSSIAVLLRTSNENITEDKIADDFGLYHRNIKILPTGLGNIYREVTEGSDEKATPYLVTQGSFLSLAYGLAYSKQLASSIRLLTLLQVIAMLLCVVTAGMIILFGGLSILEPMRIILYALFWLIVSIILPIIIKH